MVLGGRPPGRVGRRRIYSLNNPRFLTESGVVLVYGVITSALASLARLCLNAARATLVAPTAVVDLVAAVIPRVRVVPHVAHAVTTIVLVARVEMMTGLVVHVEMMTGRGVRAVTTTGRVAHVVMMTGRGVDSTEITTGRVARAVMTTVAHVAMTTVAHVASSTGRTTERLLSVVPTR